MSDGASLMDKDSFTLGRYFFAAFDLFKQGAKAVNTRLSEAAPAYVSAISGSDYGYGATTGVTTQTLTSAGLTPIATRETPTDTQALQQAASLLAPVATRTPQTFTRATPLKVSSGAAAKVTPATLSEVTSPSLTASIAEFPSVLLGSSGVSEYGSSSSYAGVGDDGTYQGVGSSSSFGLVTPVIRPAVTNYEIERPSVGSSSSSMRPAVQTGMGSSSSSMRPAVQTGMGSSSSSMRPAVQTGMGSSSSSMRPAVQTGVGSSSSSYNSLVCEADIYEPSLGTSYALPCGNTTQSFNILLHANSGPALCKDNITVNPVVNTSLTEFNTYQNVLRGFVNNTCYTSAIQFMYNHAIENGLLTPLPPRWSDARLRTFNLTAFTFMQYIITMYNASNSNITLDQNQITSILAWFDTLNTQYTDPYSTVTNNIYYVYANKQIAYLHIKNSPASSYETILSTITSKFMSPKSVLPSIPFVSDTNYQSTMPYIQTISGTKTVTLLNANGTIIYDSAGNPTTLTVTYDNDYFLTTEYRKYKAMNYHEYYLRALFSTLIVLKAKGLPQTYFDTIKPTIYGILQTLMKPNARDIYAAWSDGYKQTFTVSTMVYNEYQHIFENGTLANHWLTTYNYNATPILAAMTSTTLSSYGSAKPAGSSSSSWLSIFRGGSSSSSAKPVVAQTGVGSSSSSGRNYPCYITGYTSTSGSAVIPKSYTLKCKPPNSTITYDKPFDILLSVTTPPHYCPGTTVVNPAIYDMVDLPKKFRGTLGYFVENLCYNSAIDFYYYHAIDNALMSPVVSNGQNKFATFELLSSTFINYCILEYNANRDNVILDVSKKTAILNWFNTLNTTYTEPYKSYNTNTYYLYACKQIAYLHITNAPYSSYNDIITNITKKFQNNYPVQRTTAPNTFITLPYIETVNGTRTASLKMYGGTDGKTVVNDPNGVNFTVTYNNDKFLSTEWREQKSLSYHDYYLKMCFAALIVLKAKGAPAAFFASIKSGIKSILDTLMKPNANELYAVWSGFTQDPVDQKTKDAITVTNAFYLYIFENGTLPTNWLSLYNISAQIIVPAMASKQLVI